MFNIFPRTIWVDKSSIIQQVEHIESELKEVKQELRAGSVTEIVLELLDLAHSVETGLRICEEKYDVDIEEMRAQVIKKNQLRGYYVG